jgi:hypothetical protein
MTEHVIDKCCECDQPAQASTFTPTKVIRRCVAHWVAYYRRRESLVEVGELLRAQPELVPVLGDLWIQTATDIPPLPQRREGMA